MFIERGTLSPRRRATQGRAGLAEGMHAVDDLVELISRFGAARLSL
jgi:hypothetical protein